MRGTTVCVKHGGAARQVRNAARVNLVRLVLERDFRRDWAEYLRRRAAFFADRITITSRLLDMDPADVDTWAVLECHRKFGVPPLAHEAPVMVHRHDHRHDRFLDNPH